MIFDYSGNNVLGLIMSVRRDRPTKGVPDNYIKKDGVDNKA